MRHLPKLVYWSIIFLVGYTFIKGTQFKDLSTVLVILVFVLAIALDDLYKKRWHFKRPIKSFPEATKPMDDLIKDLEEKIKHQRFGGKLRDVKKDNHPRDGP